MDRRHHYEVLNEKGWDETKKNSNGYSGSKKRNETSLYKRVQRSGKQMTAKSLECSSIRTR